MGKNDRFVVVSFLQMREAPKMNINQFFGAVGIASHYRIVFVSSYCARGSLHDIFESPYFDSEFRASFIMDFLEVSDVFYCCRNHP